jgi:hypothetical protein
MVMFSSAFCDLPQFANEKSSRENVKPLSMQKFPCPSRGTRASVQLLATRCTRALKSVDGCTDGVNVSEHEATIKSDATPMNLHITRPIVRKDTEFGSIVET